ncbi:MAG: zinc-ribbon domain-containing protein [Alphaproteobacteria bacterium]|nr:zinc-ribbon domain-containing protein [Alphaproteobacteria bacterium]
MIVTCPTCSTRYLVDTQKLGVQGRMVRCGSCGHTWYQAPPEHATSRIDLTEPVPEPTPGVVERRGLPAIQRRRRSWGKLVALLVLLLVLAGAGWGAIFMRDRVMALVPQSARIYSRLGLAASMPDFGPGLALRDVAPRRAVENGQSVLVIDGRIVNLSSARRRVPPLKVTLRDANDKPLTSWTFSAGIAELGPGASASFHTTYQQPTADATGVVVTLQNP